MEQGLLAAAAQLQQAAQRQGDTALLQLILVGAVGLIALIACVVLALVLGRGLVRQLRELRGSALTLADDELPSIVSRLRSGQSVDLTEYTPPEVASGNEIEQVQQALRVVQHAAVQSAIDESQLRRGISDVFRNLAGRSQSLLHRQLTLLDSMERRATEPDELEDLFRIDHLTTRMRRHAEGLIILSGDTPARGWRQPVPLVDVLRAAVAEVEDYTRIRVLCRTTGSVAGHAVADVIHLLAELAENATVFSPPNTPVRMQGDSVGQGFAIEIEDRGLGVSPARLDEINVNLASPPQFDLSGSDRLGLFITSQLAQRHDIKVTLRQSVYGGTTAIVLIPTTLVVDDMLVERDPALPAAQADLLRFDRLGGRHAALTAIPAGDGHEASQANGQLGPARDADQGRRSGGFILGRITSADADADTGDGRTDRETVQALPGPVGEDPGSRDGADADVPAAAEVAELGLPIRVRQASLAPQLRDAPPSSPAESGAASGGFRLRPRGPAAGSSTPASGPPAEADPFGAPASPEAARDMMSAFQRGWQLGRAEPAPEAIEGAADDVGEEAGHSDDD
jgi:signal transduction histidine kinase